MAVHSVSIFSAQTLSVSVGNPSPAHRRITASGDYRHTEAGNNRIVNWPGERGRVQVHGPAFTLFFKHAGHWRVVSPSVRHNGVWKTPKSISIKNAGVWPTVQTPDPHE